MTHHDAALLALILALAVFMTFAMRQGMSLLLCALVAMLVVVQL